VVAAFVAVGAYSNRENLAIKIKSVFVKVPPKAAQTEPPSQRKAPAFTGDAPWALSALPECFAQVSKSTGPDLSYILAHLPKGSQMVRPPEDLYYADCVLRIRGDAVYVQRGSDRMRIPPATRVYVNYQDQKLAVLRGAQGAYELRVYETPARGGPMRI
jgi:hypothetical protein